MKYIITESQYNKIMEQPDSRFGLERFGYNPNKPETLDKAVATQRELHNSQLYRTTMQILTAFIPVVGPAISLGLLGLDVKRDYDKATTSEEKNNILLSYIVGMAFVWGLGKIFKSVATLGEDGLQTLSKKLKMKDAYKYLSTKEAAVMFELTNGKKHWEDKITKVAK